MCLTKTDEVCCMQYEVLVVHHDKEIRNRICETIRVDSELAAWGTAGSVREAYYLLQFGFPALALIDQELVDGGSENIISWLNNHAPYVWTLVLTIHGNDPRDKSATSSDASGYLHNYHQSENISPGIKLALKTRSSVFPSMPRLAEINTGKSGLNIPVTEPVSKEIRIDKPKLTPAEIDILNYVAKGFTGPEIADITGRSVNTVPVHMKSIYRKLSVSGRGEAVYRAIQLGLIGRDQNRR